jgi:hypothetical protein
VETIPLDMFVAQNFSRRSNVFPDVFGAPVNLQTLQSVAVQSVGSTVTPGAVVNLGL